MAATARPDHSETRLLRELILEHLSRWLWRTRAELQERVERDFGPIGISPIAADRRFCRQLVFLRSVGALAMRIDEEADPPMPVYRALPDAAATAAAAASAPRQFCRECGLIGVFTSTHANGHYSWRSQKRPENYVRLTWTETRAVVRNPVARLRIEAQQTTARSPDSPPPAGSVVRTDRPRRAALRAS